MNEALPDNSGDFKVDLLSDERVRELLSDYQDGNKEAEDVLVQHNLRLVGAIVQRFKGRGEIEDLFQLGCLGLIKAIRGFKLDYNVKLSTYAVPLIIGEIKQFLRDEGPIKVSRSLKSTAYKVEQERQKLLAEQGREPTLNEIAASCELSCEEIIEALEAVKPPDSLQETVFGGDGDEIKREQLIGTQIDEYQEWIEHYALREALARIPPRLQKIIEMRFFEERTQSEIAIALGVSQVQICRLEKTALAKLQDFYEN